MGLTQQEAEGRGAAYITSTYNYSDTAYGAPIEVHDGFVKVLADHETEEILGCHIIGTDAATLIQEVANVMRSRAGVDGEEGVQHAHTANTTPLGTPDPAAAAQGVVPRTRAPAPAPEPPISLVRVSVKFN